MHVPRILMEYIHEKKKHNWQTLTVLKIKNIFNVEIIF